MVHNCYIKCQVCGCITRVRLQVGWQESHPIVVTCGECMTSLFGRVKIGQDTPGLEYHFDNADVCNEEDKEKYIVECSGEFPVFKQRLVAEDEGYVLTPFIRATEIMAEGYEEFSTSVRQLSDTAKRWANYKRIQNLSKVNSPYVKQEIQKIFSGEFFQCRDEYELLRAVHMIDVHAFYTPLKKELLNNMDFSSSILKLDRAQLRRLLNYLENHSGYHLEELQNLIYKLMDEFMSVYQSLIPAFALQFYTDEFDLGVEGTTTSTFNTVKQFYLDVYEGLGNLLIIPIALDNIKIRNDFEKMAPVEKNIFSIDEFVATTKATRFHYIYSNEPHVVLADIILNAKLRNAIGHNDVEYDTVTQCITYIPNPKDRSKRNQEYLLQFENEALRMFQGVLVISEYIYRLRQLTLMEKGITPIRPNVPIVKSKKIGRNEPCPCGSGKKFKHCHGRNG